jgi:hypothetical protein
VIYLRHGRSQYDQLQLERDQRALGTFDLVCCDTQRQLSNERREELVQACGQFRLANLPLEGVYTSRYFRVIESAAFFVDGVEPTAVSSGRPPASRCKKGTCWCWTPAS